MNIRSLFDSLNSALADVHDEHDTLISCGEADKAIAQAAESLGYNLRALGFEFIGEGEFSKAWRGIVEGLDLVVKLAYTREGVNYPSDDDLARFPALRERLVPALMHSKFVMIQPAVQARGHSTCPKWLRRFERAAEALAYRFYQSYDVEFDCHPGNVGFQNGKMMIFDANV